MNEHRMHYALAFNGTGKSSTRLRHLKYLRSFSFNSIGAKETGLTECNEFVFKKEIRSLKSVNRLRLPELQTNNHALSKDLGRLAKSLKHISFVEVYNSKHVNPKWSKTEAALLLAAKNLEALKFSYEINNPAVSDNGNIYETVLSMKGNGQTKSAQKILLDNIFTQMERLNVVLPKDIVFVMDFKVPAARQDHSAINGFQHHQRSLWSLAISIFTLNNLSSPYAYKIEPLWSIRKMLLSCDSSNKCFESLKEFVTELSDIEALYLRLDGSRGIDQQVTLKDFVSIVQPRAEWADNLRNLGIECKDIAFDPIELTGIHFPKDLTSLELNLKNTQIKSLENIHYIEQFPAKLLPLVNLKTLNLSFPTTCMVNQMIHNLPENLQEVEILRLEFPETSTEAAYEEIYLNSLLEWLSAMPKLQEIYLKTEKLNYTYCGYLSHEEMPSSLKKLQWIDTSLYCGSRLQKQGKTKQWIECRKFEDLNIILRLLSATLEYLELPFVFDGLESEFVALRLLELIPELKNLKTLNLALGFKILDESNVESIDNFVSQLRSVINNRKGFHMTLNVFYRKTKDNVSVDELNHRNHKNISLNGKYHIQYIHDVHY